VSVSATGTLPYTNTQDSKKPKIAEIKSFKSQSKIVKNPSSACTCVFRCKMLKIELTKKLKCHLKSVKLKLKSKWRTPSAFSNQTITVGVLGKGLLLLGVGNAFS